MNKINNYIVTYLNEIFKTDKFELYYRNLEYGKAESYDLRYDNKTILFTQMYYDSEIFKSELSNNLKLTFERELLNDIIFGKPTNGNYVNSFGDSILTFADIKQEFILKNNGK